MSTEERAADTPALLCYDGSESARHAIAKSGDLLGGGPAIVLTVWEPFEASLLRPVSDAVATASGLAREFDEIAHELALKHAREGADLAGQAGFDATPLALPGRPRDVILTTAVERGARAIVLGSRGLGGARSVLLGSVSAAVLHHCRGLPVLVVPRATD